MMFRKAALLAGLSLACVFSSSASAQNSQRYLEGAFSGAVRENLVRNFGNTQANFSQGWGSTSRVWTGETKFVPRGLSSRVEKIYRNRNHGQWIRGWARLENARQNFDIRFRNFRKTPGRMEVRFQVYVRGTFRAWAQARQYKAGIRLFDVDATGRADAHIYLNMRVHLSRDGRTLHWKCESADVKYSNVVLDRVGRVGGFGARLVGDGIRGAIRQWFPQQERTVLNNAKRAVSQALSGSARIRGDVTRMIRTIR